VDVVSGRGGKDTKEKKGSPKGGEIDESFTKDFRREKTKEGWEAKDGRQEGYRG